MSNKYTETQELAIISILKGSTDHETMRKGLESLLKSELKGFTIREVMSKARHICSTFNDAEIPLVYWPKQYKSKVGTTPIRKAVHIKELCALLNIDETDDLESLTKMTLISLITAIKALKD